MSQAERHPIFGQSLNSFTDLVASVVFTDVSGTAMTNTGTLGLKGWSSTSYAYKFNGYNSERQRKLHVHFHAAP